MSEPFPFPDDGGPDPSAFAAGFARSREAIDAAVLRAGERLGHCAVALNRHSGILEALPRDFQGAELDEACATLRRIGDEATAIVDAFADERTTMDALGRSLSEAASPLADLQRSIKTIGILSVNARVVAAGLGDVEGFEVFTVDIARLSREAAATVNRFTERFERLRADLRQVAVRRGKFEAAHAATLSGLGGRLALRLDRVDERRHSAAETSRRTSETVRQIAGRVGAVVLSLQSGDRMRQRIEHIEAALSPGHTARLDEDAAPDADTPGEHIRTVGALAAEQLAAAVDEFDPDLQAAHEALEGLAGDALDIARQAEALVRGSGDGDAPIPALTGELQLAIDLLARSANERSGLDALAERVASAVAELLTEVESVQDVEAEMRVLSLNAAVKCAQLGARGRALNVVAQQLRELTTETVASAEAAIEALRGSERIAAAIRSGSRSDLAGAIGRIEAAARAATDRLQQLEGRTGEAVDTLAKEGPGMSRTLSTAAADIAAARQEAARLADGAARLAASADDGSTLEDDLVASLLATLQKLRAGYTMEDERRIHDQFAARIAERRSAVGE